MKYVFIENHRAEFSIKAMCRVLRVARSGWYVWLRRRHQMSLRQQFQTLPCVPLSIRHSLRQSSDTVLPALLTKCRSSILKPLPACVVRGCGRKPAGSSAQSATVHMACPVLENLLEQDFSGASGEPSGRVASYLRTDEGLVVSRSSHRPVVTRRYWLVDVTANDSTTGLMMHCKWRCGGDAGMSAPVI